MRKILLSVFILGLTSGVFAQQENLSNSTEPIQAEDPPIDGYMDKSDIENRKVVPYANIRATDVAYSKRVWREIDLRERLNKAFASPKSRLIDILIEAVMAGELTAYDPTPTENDPTGDSFKNILPPDQVMARFGGDSTLVEVYDENNEVVSSHYEATSFDGEEVIKFRIKEDWIFDKQRSVFEPRIIGIAPLITPHIPGMESTIGLPGENDDDTEIGADPFDPFAVSAEPEEDNIEDEGVESEEIDNENIPMAGMPKVDPTPAFWVYFPEARHVLVNKEVMDYSNDATGLSYDDIFIQRKFRSYIIKESNPEDVRIKDYIEDDMDRLLESERIKKSLVDFEQDLWSY